MHKERIRLSLMFAALVALNLVPLQLGCGEADPWGFEAGARPAGGPLELAENVSIDVREVGGELQTIFRFSDTLNNPPNSGRVNFPPNFFDGFEDGGIKSLVRLAAVFSFSQTAGLPVFVVDNSRATINAAPPINFQVQGDSLLLSTASTGPIPPGGYTLSFLPGVFNLGPGAYDLEMIATWPDTSTFTFNKLLLVSAAVVPHFGLGRYGDIDVASVFVFNNPGHEDVSLDGEFFQPDGSALEVEIGGEAGSQFQLDVPAQASATVEVEAVGEGVQTGWAWFQADGPFQVSSLFANSDADTDHVRTAAGIAASSLATRHVLIVGKSPEGLNTAFAISNPTGATASLKLVLESPAVERSIEMESHTQMAVFVDGFFDISEMEEIGSSLVIYSDTDVAVMAMITINGEQFASLPSGTHF